MKVFLPGIECFLGGSLGGTLSFPFCDVVAGRGATGLVVLDLRWPLPWPRPLSKLRLDGAEVSSKIIVDIPLLIMYEFVKSPYQFLRDQSVIRGCGRYSDFHLCKFHFLTNDKKQAESLILKSRLVDFDLNLNHINVPVQHTQAIQRETEAC